MISDSTSLYSFIKGDLKYNNNNDIYNIVDSLKDKVKLDIICKSLGISKNDLLKLRRKVIPEPVDYVDKPYEKYVTRYHRFRQLMKDGKIFYETYERYGVLESADDEYYIVDASTENRLDIIADKFYNNKSYWWVIAQANGIIDPFNIPINMTLRIPLLTSLYLEGGILS